MTRQASRSGWIATLYTSNYLPSTSWHAVSNCEKSATTHFPRNPENRMKWLALSGRLGMSESRQSNDAAGVPVGRRVNC